MTPEQNKKQHDFYLTWFHIFVEGPKGIWEKISKEQLYQLPKTTTFVIANDLGIPLTITTLEKYSAEWGVSEEA